MRPTCAKAVKAEQQVIAEPAVVGPKPGKPGNSGEPTQFATGLTSIFVGAIPKAVTDDQLQVMLGTKAHIGRRHGKAKFGYTKILIPRLSNTDGVIICRSYRLWATKTELGHTVQRNSRLRQVPRTNSTITLLLALQFIASRSSTNVGQIAK